MRVHNTFAGHKGLTTSASVQQQINGATFIILFPSCKISLRKESLHELYSRTYKLLPELLHVQYFRVDDGDPAIGHNFSHFVQDRSGSNQIGPKATSETFTTLFCQNKTGQELCVKSWCSDENMIISRNTWIVVWPKYSRSQLQSFSVKHSRSWYQSFPVTGRPSKSSHEFIQSRKSTTKKRVLSRRLAKKAMGKARNKSWPKSTRKIKN
jgi:hypothetical protein